MVSITKIIISCIVIPSIILNCGTCYLLIRIKKKNSYIVLCIHLAISDLLQALCGYTPELLIDVYDKEPTKLCIGSALIVSQMALTSISIITLISMCRIVDLIKTSPSQKYNLLKINLLALSAWGYAAFWSFSPICGWSRYVLERSGNRCTLDWTLKTSNAKSYVYSISIFCYVLPIIIHAVSFIIAKKVMKKHRRYLSKLYGRRNSTTTHVKREERKTSALCFLMFSAFIMAWTPYTFVGLLSQQMTVPVWCLDASAILAKSSTLFNPLIYCYKAKFKHKRFLKEFKKCNIE
ncbi:rhodopsin, G0-coupled-like [Hydractinia symbiolongicarpus]|uniref:rhodopsin, G0-coupled-like n=1 Tax=Hydractinia symbiolongicarpus TaxID=13093 RepID=UPI00254DA68E|nr:rhodopsin, G0-coupled-like [Hydractinia symbiolongicarpus]